MQFPQVKNILKYFNLFRKKTSFAFLKYSFLLLFVLYLFGISPVSYISATIKNITNNYETISLYPETYSLDQENDDYHSGWWNVDNALSKPSLEKGDSLIYFSDTNSAFYSGGEYEVVFSNFSLPSEYASDDNEEDETKEVEIVNINSEDNNEDDPIVEDNVEDEILPSDDTEYDDSSIENNEVFEELSSTTEEILIEEQDNDSDIISEENDVTSSTPEVLGVSEEFNEEAEVFEGEIKDPLVEILDDIEDEDAPEVEVMDIESNEPENDDLSIYPFYNIAKAQSKEESSLNKFGEFKSAKISFSLAYTSMDAFQEDRDEDLRDIEKERDELENQNNEDDSQSLDDNIDSAEGDNDLNENENGQVEENDESNINEGVADESESDFAEENNSQSGDEDNLDSDNIEDDFNSEVDENNNDNSSIEIIEDTDEPLLEENEENIQDEKEINEEAEESIQEDMPEENEFSDNENIEPEDEIEENVEDASEKIFEDSPEENSTEEAKVTGEDVSLFNFKKIAQAENNLDEKIIIWYSVDTKEASGSLEHIKWHKLKTIYADNYSNALNEGFLSLEASEIQSWEDLDNLAIKLEGVSENDNTFVFYLDSLWLDIDYVRAEDAPEPEEEKLKRWQDSLELISGEEFFDIEEEGEFRFKYTKNSQKVLESLGEFFGFVNYWKDVDLQVSLLSASGKELDTPVSIIFEDNGEFSFKLPEIDSSFEPGKYKIVFTILDSSGEKEEEIKLDHDFVWGVLAFNTDKSVYYPEESAYLQMAVLDDYGHTICNADISLEITDPSGRLSELSTGRGDIFLSEECGPKTVTNIPDYYAHYQLGEMGNYEIKLIAKTKNGIREASHTIKVRDNQSFDVSRKSATRIFPKSDYIMEINIIAKEDYLGDIREYLPSNFKLLSQEITLLNNEERDPFSANYKFENIKKSNQNVLLWQGVDLREGDELLIKYTYDAPDISPEFYLLGPLETDIFLEERSWQIASDAISKRAKTVMFMAGTYNGGASAGQNSDTNQTFSTFNFRLAESGVEIKNAYIMFESMFEAYSNGNTYTGYNLAFDSCVESCTADAFSGTNRVLQDDNTTLAYSETESNEIRLLMDVTDETQLAVYSGEGEEMEAQVGYRLEKGSAASSISNAKAVLYITYLYDADSENITNTVSYPLDSTDGTDSGTRRSSVGSCTLDDNCPIFDYKMDIPEWPGVATSTNRVSQWFRMFNANDGNNTTDMDLNVNIQNYNIDSETFHHESQNGGTQGNMAAMYFPDWTNSGYAENSSQQLELYLNSGTNYDAGGEVFETYIASSSASIKTRTVTFPLGVLNNGNTTDLSSAEADVYFPENGNASNNVTVKSAYFRIVTHNQNSATLSTTISSKVGTNATSSDFVYNYNGGGSVIKPSHNIIHIIPSADYSELEGADASNAKKIILNATQSATTYGGISAELVITYTYSDESTGYLTNINLYGGQSDTSPATSTTISTANSVMPEASGKTVLSAGILSSYLNSDSGGTVGSGVIFLLDANLSTATPNCTPAYRAEPDDINSFSEFYKNVTSAMTTDDDQSYSACYVDDESLVDTDGAKMSGQLIYTYQWDNSPPTGSFNSLIQKNNGSKTVDISIEAFDIDGHDVRAKIEYEATSTCAFTTPLDPTLDERDENISADYNDPEIENDNIYQVGTSNAYITTASGTNSVLFDWLAPSGVDSTYCLRLTVNDNMMDQENPATSTVYIDTLNPASPGTLSLFERTGTSLTLNFGTSTVENNFSEYKIFYKVYDGTDPNESDSVLASSTDTNLGDISFNGATTTIISGLTAKTTYSIAIWAYDDYGNRASSTRVDIYTNDAPISSFNSVAQRTDGSGIVDISIEVDDNNNDDTNILQVSYVSGSDCNFSTPLDPSLDETSENIYADFGAPSLENDWDYQIGTSGAYILTSPGANTLEFDWFSAIDQVSADATYCVRTIVNDSYDDQKIVSTSTVILDNVNPTSPGDLSLFSIGLDNIILSFATSTPAIDTNEPIVDAYKIFYKEGSSGVTESDTEHDDSVLNSYDYNGATSTTISGLDSDTAYVINIWAYDSFGNKISANEIVVSTNSTLVNESLIFTNATSTNILLMDGTTEWNFQANVSETDGWYALDEVELGLANLADDTSAFDDLRFKWSQSLQSFSEIGTDTNNAVTLSPNSTSTCAVNNCEINFKLIFDKSFASSSVDYDAELLSSNDSAKEVDNNYTDFYQARYIELEQIHYRWRNDDGGE